MTNDTETIDAFQSTFKPARKNARVLQKWDGGVVIAFIHVIAEDNEECLRKGNELFARGVRFNTAESAE